MTGCWPAGFLPGAFQVQLQARGPAPGHAQAGAHPVGPGRAVRQDRPGIGGQEAGAEGRGHAIAEFRGQPAGRRWPGALRRQARRGLPGPEAVHAAGCRAPRGGERQGQALAIRPRVDAERPARAPFLIVAVFVGEQAPDGGFEGQAQGRVGVLHPAAQFEAEPGFGVAPVMPDPQLHGRGHALAFRPRDVTGAFQHQPQPVRLRVGRGEARNGSRRRAREHGVRARGQLVARVVHGREQDAPAAEGPHQQRRVRLQGAAGLRLQGSGRPSRSPGHSTPPPAR